MKILEGNWGGLNVEIDLVMHSSLHNMLVFGSVKLAGKRLSVTELSDQVCKLRSIHPALFQDQQIIYVFIAPTIDPVDEKRICYSNTSAVHLCFPLADIFVKTICYINICSTPGK